MKAKLVVEALQKALRWRGNLAGGIIHSDRGSQYTSNLYQSYVGSQGLRGSMSGKKHCYDNAVMERFFGTLKDWFVVGERQTSPDELLARISRWIETEYSVALPHSQLGNLTPMEYEEAFYVPQAA